MRSVIPKRLILTSILSGLLLPSLILADPVNVEQAGKAANTFLKVRNSQPQKDLKMLSVGGTQQVSARQLIAAGVKEILSDDGTVLAYVTELEPQGFLATSSDTDITPIIAYSFKSDFPTDGENNPLLSMLKRDMESRLRAAPEYSESTKAENNALWVSYTTNDPEDINNESFQQWPEEGTTSTGGWVDTAWHQGPPYNNFCPIDPQTGQRSWAGCTATAVAQIVNYHKYVNDPIFDIGDSYISNGIQIDPDSTIYDFPSFDYLNQLLSNVQYKYDNNIPLDDNDVAAINFACGVALRAEYSSSYTGARLSTNPFIKFAYYSAEYESEYPDFYNILKNNLKTNVINGLPAVLGISGEYITKTGELHSVTHSIIVDGYNTDGFYHVNFGQAYGGTVWILMPEGFPPAYTEIRDCLLNIIPKIEKSSNLISSDVTEINLSSSYVGHNDRIGAFTLTNISDSPVDIHVIYCPNGFRIAETSDFSFDEIEDFQINTGETEHLYIQFLPDSARYFNGDIIVKASNQNKTQFLTIPVKGYGVPENAIIVNQGDPIYGVWQKEKSPYYVCGDINVGWLGQGLTIEPGVTVKVFDGRIDVMYASLKAVGTETEKITFTAADMNLGWKGIRFYGNQSSFNELSFCIISNATLLESPSAAEGSIIILNSSPTITNNIITENLNGIYIYGNSSPVLSNNFVCNNRGCGIDCLNMTSDVYRISNNIICNNNRGAIHCSLASPEIVNNTIVNNGDNCMPLGIYCSTLSSPIIRNNIIWGNGGDSINQICLLDSTNTPRIEYNNIQGGIMGVSIPQGFSFDLGEGNFDSDPCFVNSTTGIGKDYDALLANWHLISGSLCIDTGNPNDPVGDEPFPHGFRINLGAYGGTAEAQITTGPSLAVTPNPVDLGAVSANYQSERTFCLKNGGDCDIEVTSVSLSETTNFSVRDSNGISEYHKILTPGSIDSLTITLTPIPDVSVAYSDTIIAMTDKLGQIKVPVLAQACPGTVIADESVSGTWTFNDSPFYLTCDVSITQGDTLLIEPGVNVLFTGQFGLTVGENATLTAKGTKQEKISFLPSDTSNTWEGISFINSSSDDVLDYCVIKSCKHASGEHDAGAIYCNNSSPNISNSIITNNIGQNGGGISCINNSFTMIINNIIANNRVLNAGGGIYCISSSPFIESNIIVNNTCEMSGGGMMVRHGNPIITNNTICNNYATYAGGVVFQYSSALVKNTIIWGNVPSQIYTYESNPNILFSDIEGGLDYSNILNIDPHFVQPSLGAGADFDGLAADFHLQANSPCINAGDPNYLAGADEVDIDSDARIIGGRIDIGADEFSYAELSDLNNDGAVDFKDFDVLARYWMDYACSEPDWCEGGDFDRSGTVSHVDLLVFVENWLAPIR